MATEAQLRAVSKYQKKNVHQVSLKFYPGDKDLWDYVKEQSNKNGYIKDLIRRDMESQPV